MSPILTINPSTVACRRGIFRVVTSADFASRWLLDAINTASVPPSAAWHTKNTIANSNPSFPNANRATGRP